ncbi:MAG: lysylphosphatidylglycerol synthase transmembrane domain-containing protein [Kouleothrix sp.]
MSTRRRVPRWASTLLRVVVSGSVLAFLVVRAQPGQIWQAWRAIDLPLLGLALLMQLAGLAISAAKWGVLLAAQGRRQPLRWLFGAYLVGQFVGNVLLTTIGGDAVRAVQLGRRIGSYGEAGASIFLERLTGFLALSLIANAALAAGVLVSGGAALATTPALTLLALALGLGALAALGVALAAPWLQRALGLRLPRLLQARWRAPPRCWRPTRRAAGGWRWCCSCRCCSSRCGSRCTPCAGWRWASMRRCCCMR